MRLGLVRWVESTLMLGLTGPSLLRDVRRGNRSEILRRCAPRDDGQRRVDDGGWFCDGALRWGVWQVRWPGQKRRQAAALQKFWSQSSEFTPVCAMRCRHLKLFV